jgi:hypothetical protein
MGGSISRGLPCARRPALADPARAGGQRAELPLRCSPQNEFSLR